MCGVEGAAIIAVITTTAQLAQSQSQQSKQERFRQRQEEKSRQNALATLAIQTAEIHEQQLLDHESAALELQTNSRAAERAISQATVTAGEIGAFGRSFEGLIGEFERQEAEFSSLVMENLAIKNQFASLNLRSAELGKDARIINAQTQPVPRVNYFGYALQGLNTYFQLERSFGSVKNTRTGKSGSTFRRSRPLEE